MLSDYEAGPSMFISRLSDTCNLNSKWRILAFDKFRAQCLRKPKDALLF
jgi:hypothetical protein